MAVALMAIAAPAVANASSDSGAPVGTELTFDVDVASVTAALARGVRPGVLLGAGLGFGPSPILGRVFVSSAHYADKPSVYLAELVSAQLFARFEPVAWLHVDGGLRAGAFVHGGESFSGGPFVALYAAPSVGWRWLWIGPRVSGGLLTEIGDGPGSATLAIDYVVARLALGW